VLALRDLDFHVLGLELRIIVLRAHGVDLHHLGQLGPQPARHARKYVSPARPFGLRPACSRLIVLVELLPLADERFQVLLSSAAPAASFSCGCRHSVAQSDV
jgi:hypothetical protein